MAVYNWHIENSGWYEIAVSNYVVSGTLQITANASLYTAIGFAIDDRGGYLDCCFESQGQCRGGGAFSRQKTWTYDISNIPIGDQCQGSQFMGCQASDFRAVLTPGIHQIYATTGSGTIDITLTTIESPTPPTYGTQPPIAKCLPVPIFSVIKITLDNPTPLPGETVTATATVENSGIVSGTKSVIFSYDGIELARHNVTLDAGQRTQVSVSFAAPAVGDYLICAN